MTNQNFKILTCDYSHAYTNVEGTCFYEIEDVETKLRYVLKTSQFLEKGAVYKKTSKGKFKRVKSDISSPVHTELDTSKPTFFTKSAENALEQNSYERLNKIVDYTNYDNTWLIRTLKPLGLVSMDTIDSVYDNIHKLTQVILRYFDVQYPEAGEAGRGLTQIESIIEELTTFISSNKPRKEKELSYNELLIDLQNQSITIQKQILEIYQKQATQKHL